MTFVRTRFVLNLFKLTVVDSPADLPSVYRPWRGSAKSALAHIKNQNGRHVFVYYGRPRGWSIVAIT